MAELKATVCLQGKDIEVISSHIEFNRKTDNKGKPPIKYPLSLYL